MLHDLLHRDIDLPFDIVRVNWQETYQEPALLCVSPERCVFTHPAKTHEGTGLVDLSFISKKCMPTAFFPSGGGSMPNCWLRVFQ